MFLGMKNEVMAKVAKVNESGQVIRRFLVHGSKIRLCHWSGQEEDEQEIWKVRPGLLPDFPDSEVTAPLSQPADYEEGEERREESVQPIEQLEVEDEAARATYTHTRHTDNTDNFTTESLAPHTIQSRDETLRPHRPHDTHTEFFDKTDLGSTIQLD